MNEAETEVTTVASQASVIDSLRKQREELAEERTRTIAIPGFDEPSLLVEYKLMDGASLERIQRAVFQGQKDRWQRQLLTAIDVMVEAACGVYYSKNGSEPSPLMDGDGLPISGYTPELGELLGLEDTTPRLVVLGVFASNDLAIARHSIRLQAWMSGETTILDDEFLGEGL